MATTGGCNLWACCCDLKTENLLTLYDMMAFHYYPPRARRLLYNSSQQRMFLLVITLKP